MKKLLITFSILLFTKNITAQCLSGDCVNGFGKFQYKEAVYEGYWKNSAFNGIGIIIYNNGTYYFGEFVKNQFQGYGALFQKNGENYAGQWQNGKQHGIGTIKNPAKNQNNAGTWKDSRFITNFITDSATNNPSNCIAGNCINGFGRMTEGKETIEAIFKDGKAIFGKIGNRNQIYEGNIANNLANGYGQIKYANGDHYFGYFKNGLKHGLGILTKTDATRTHGTWEHDDWQFTFNETEFCNQLNKYLSSTNEERKSLKVTGLTSDLKRSNLEQKFLNYFKMQQQELSSSRILFPEDKENVPTITQQMLINGLQACKNFTSMQNPNQFEFNKITITLKKGEYGIFTKKPQIELVITFPKDETDFCRELLALVNLTKEERKAIKLVKNNEGKTFGLMETKFLGKHRMEYNPDDGSGDVIFITYNLNTLSYEGLKSLIEKCNTISESSLDELNNQKHYYHRNAAITVGNSFVGNFIKILY